MLDSDHDEIVQEFFAIFRANTRATERGALFGGLAFVLSLVAVILSLLPLILHR